MSHAQAQEPETLLLLSTPAPIDEQLKAAGVVDFRLATFGRLSMALMRSNDDLVVVGAHSSWPSRRMSQQRCFEMARGKALHSLTALRIRAEENRARRADFQSGTQPSFRPASYEGCQLAVVDAGGGP